MLTSGLVKMSAIEITIDRNVKMSTDTSCYQRQGNVKCERSDRAVKKGTHDKLNKMTCAPKEDSDQPGQSPSLISRPV